MESDKAFKQFNDNEISESSKQAETEITTSESAVKKQEEFEEMKKKTRNMLFGLAAVFVLVISGAAFYKAMQ